MFAAFRKRHPGSSLAHVCFFDFCRRTVHTWFLIVYRLRTEGVEHVPAQGAVLIVANHQSFYDPPAIGGAITHRHTDFLARGGLFKFRLFGWLITKLNSTPIKQGAGDAGAMKEILKRLSEGKAVIVFPEGSRTPDGELQDLQRGTLVLIKRAKCPIVPAAISGAYEAWPRTRMIPRLFSKRMAVSYGNPIDGSELMANGTDAAMERLESEIRTQLERANQL